jgi:carbon starvation protein
MLMESFVAVMALIAACVLTPGVYFAINAPVAAIGTTAASASQAVAQWGFTVTPETLNALAAQVGESSLLSRVGGAPSLAVGMAHIFSSALGGGGGMALWYHFAIMFEALFILTTLDAGTRVGRFMMQDMLGNLWEPLGRTHSLPANILSSALIVGGWGYFLYQGVIDPLGGINSLWPLFGIANQLLAATALTAVTTIFVKSDRPRFAVLTAAPLAWLLVVTMTAGWQKIFSENLRIGFLAQAAHLASQIESGAIAADRIAETRHVIFNNQLDAVVTAAFMLLVAIVVLDAARVWYKVLFGAGHRAVAIGEVHA